MARECYFTGKKTKSGNNKSHSNRKTKRTFKPNLIKKVIMVDGEPKKVNVSSRYYKRHRNEFVN